MAESKQSLKAKLQELNKSSMYLTTGTVTKANPLAVELDNEISMGALDSDSLTVPEHLTDHKTTVTYTENNTTVTREMTIKSGLKVGDKVTLLATDYGEDYYILGKEA